MKISDSSSIRSAQGLRRKSAGAGVGAGGFESLLGGLEAAGTAEAGGIHATAGISSVDGMLALQSMSDGESRQREAVQQGHSMLDALESLRSSLLSGIVPPEVLQELDRRLARQRTEVSDPKLLEILDDIELRVAVEKAKLEMAVRMRDLLA